MPGIKVVIPSGPREAKGTGSCPCLPTFLPAVSCSLQQVSRLLPLRRIAVSSGAKLWLQVRYRFCMQGATCVQTSAA